MSSSFDKHKMGSKKIPYNNRNGFPSAKKNPLKPHSAPPSHRHNTSNVFLMQSSNPQSTTINTYISRIEDYGASRLEHSEDKTNGSFFPPFSMARRLSQVNERNYKVTHKGVELMRSRAVQLEAREAVAEKQQQGNTIP